ncbi:MAG: radical SAM protein [Calditrichaeota bacterium]|nr:radical SAM protein [Calditrichota bacterium]
MKLTFQETEVRRIVNVRRHADAWFWDRYSALPYVGCRSGCAFCYLRSGRYLRGRSPDEFDTVIGVKINAAERLRRELPRLKPDVILCGDWQQPAESRYQLFRKMLEVVLEAAFPLLVVERSPLLVRDLDLLLEIHRRTHVSVLFSLSSPDPKVKRVFEPRSPGIRMRLRALTTLAKAGIPVGLALMPVFPHITNRASLRELITAAYEHGACCVVAGMLTMEDLQAEWTLRALERGWPELVPVWRRLYGLSSAANTAKTSAGKESDLSALSVEVARTVREICQQIGIPDRLPRPVWQEERTSNRRLAEHFHNRAYTLELEQASPYRVWAYRKAAWSVDDYPEDVERLARSGGEKALRSLPQVGPGLAREALQWLKASGHLS